ncbi:E3 ubiquitin-protein ligase RNF6-like [Impatiens glandulifera]|uniref:E3 ubiquitin-protein ligase RNF6-like n=1 Tax=Impatiens glandulifera TaxID=253017 RepID=UPI001FB110A6|nr:E3 ubiquitin-protein ligase RNF6-like [Impatiens glandulifera]
MERNGRISSNDGIGNGYLENLELNYIASLESFDHHVPLSLINGQHSVGLSAGHHHDQDDINGNLQPHPLQPPQQQRNYLVMGGAMPVHHFMTPMQFRLHQEMHSHLAWQQTQLNYELQLMNSYRPSTDATMGLDIINSQSRPIQSSAPAAAATRPSSSRRDIRTNTSNVPIYQHRSITTGRRRRRNLLVTSILQSSDRAAVILTSHRPLVNIMPNETIYEVEVDHEAGLSEEEIMMSVERFKSEHDGEACCICLEDYIHGEDICKLRCNHIYHFDCIKRWLMQKNFCPMCKAPAMYFDDIQPSHQTARPQQAAP